MERDRSLLVRRHLAFGFGSLAAWMLLGLVLEALHAWKVAWLLGDAAEPRRLLLRLAHAHGALLGTVNAAYPSALPYLDEATTRWTSRLLVGASLALPLGFLGGAFGVQGGDAGIAIVLAPVGGAMLVVAAAAVGRGILREPRA